MRFSSLLLASVVVHKCDCRESFYCFGYHGITHVVPNDLPLNRSLAFVLISLHFLPISKCIDEKSTSEEKKNFIFKTLILSNHNNNNHFIWILSYTFYSMFRPQCSLRERKYLLKWKRKNKFTLIYSNRKWSHQDDNL